MNEKAAEVVAALSYRPEVAQRIAAAKPNTLGLVTAVDAPIGRAHGELLVGVRDGRPAAELRIGGESMSPERAAERFTARELQTFWRCVTGKLNGELLQERLRPLAQEMAYRVASKHRGGR